MCKNKKKKNYTLYTIKLVNGYRSHYEDMLFYLDLILGLDVDDKLISEGERWKGVWKDCDTDIRQITKKYPDILVEITAKSDDGFNWKGRFMNDTGEKMLGNIDIDFKVLTQEYWNEHFNSRHLHDYTFLYGWKACRNITVKAENRKQARHLADLVFKDNRKNCQIVLKLKDLIEIDGVPVIK